MIIAVDGTAASGKGTLARGLAKHLNLAHLDTGSLYRGVAVRLSSRGMGADDEDAAIAEAKALQPNDLSHPDLRHEAIGRLASRIASIGGVRAALLAWQREFAATPPKDKHGAVLDGRDIGTVVLPHADIKFFCDAGLDIRAQRRYNELRQLGESPSFNDVLRDLETRDRQDSTRTHAPLAMAEDAIRFDTGKVGVEEMIKMGLASIQAR